VIKVMYFDEPAAGASLQPGQGGGIGALLAVNGVAVLAFGLLPGGLMAMCRDAILKALAT
jgi:NADH-quinone oxidoreductase subunit N